MLNKNSLLELPKDDRDLKLGSIFRKEIKVPNEDFIVADLPVLDQGNTMLCAAYSAVLASMQQEKVELSPFYQALKANQLGANIFEEGTDLRRICKTAIKFGSLETSQCPQNIAFLRDFHDLPAQYDFLAKNHAKESFFSVEDYGIDKFDSIRNALWEHKSFVITGMKWRASWTNGDGMIKDGYEDDGFGHAFTFVGQRILDGETYLIAQLSNGTEIGDEGRFYFPRKIVNKECSYGNFCFIDMPVDTAKTLVKWNLSSKWSWLISCILEILK